MTSPCNLVRGSPLLSARRLDRQACEAARSVSVWTPASAPARTRLVAADLLREGLMRVEADPSLREAVARQLVTLRDASVRATLAAKVRTATV